MRDFRFHFCCFSCCCCCCFCYFLLVHFEAYGRAPLSAAAAKAAVAVAFWGFPKKKWNTMKKTTTKATATTKTRCLVSLEGNRAQLPVSRRPRRRRYDITRRRSGRRCCCRYRCCCGGKLNTNFWLGFCLLLPLLLPLLLLPLFHFCNLKKSDFFWGN